MRKDTRPISWIKAARKEFGKFPQGARTIVLRALTIAAEGSKSDIAKLMKGLGSGVYEIALAYRSDAYRAVYAVKLGEEIWVVHAFQKKSTKGIKTPKREIDLIRSRISQLKEQLR
jgi:phage-related protein